MVEEVPIVFEFGDSRMYGKAVFSRSCKRSAACPFSIERCCSSIFYAFATSTHRCIGKVVHTISLVQPRSLYIVLHIENANLSVNTFQVGSKLCKEACSVAPAHPCRSIVIDKYRWVNIIPPSTSAIICHGICYKRFAYMVNKWTFRAIAYSNTYHLSAIRLS